MKITSLDKNVKELFSASYYEIPRFQRPYSWDKENIDEFLNDTLVDESETDYFIGSIVVFKKGNSDIFGIVDGQQRLTTITMILCSLRNSFLKYSHNDLAQGIHRLIERQNLSNENQYILSTETSYPYFQEHIQKYENNNTSIKAGEEEKNIEESFIQINEFIEDVIEPIENNKTKSEETKKNEIKQSLINIRDKILNLKLIYVELDNEDDAYVIFETLNTRGKDLSVSDLAKNHFAKYIKAKNPKSDTVKIQWSNIITLIEDSGTDDEVDSFLLHYWLSKYDYTTIKKLFKKMRKLIKSDNAQTYLNDIEKDATTYRELIEPSYRKWSIEERSIKNSLDAVSIFKVKQQMPLMLSLMRDYKDNILKLRYVLNAFMNIEKFHFLFTAVTSRRSSGGISQMYASTARKIFNAKDARTKIEELNELTKKLKYRMPSYEQFEASFRQIYFTNTYTKNKKLVKYILSKIDSDKSTGVDVNYESMTIEHIEPQNPKTGNKLDEKILGQIGNLILVNQDFNCNQLANKTFMEKKKLIAKSDCKLDEYIEQKQIWGPKEIEERTTSLAKEAYNNIWKIK